MRQKADHILESIPDRNERLNASQLDNITFVSAPPAAAESAPYVNGTTTNGVLTNGLPGEYNTVLIPAQLTRLRPA